MIRKKVHPIELQGIEFFYVHRVAVILFVTSLTASADSGIDFFEPRVHS